MCLELSWAIQPATPPQAPDTQADLRDSFPPSLSCCPPASRRLVWSYSAVDSLTAYLPCSARRDRPIRWEHMTILGHSLAYLGVAVLAAQDAAPARQQDASFETGSMDCLPRTPDPSYTLDLGRYSHVEARIADQTAQAQDTRNVSPV